MKEALSLFGSTGAEVPCDVEQYQRLGELLHSIGWSSTCDAQWHGLRDNLARMASMLG